MPEFFSTAVTVFAIVVLGAECDFGLWLLFAIPYTFLIIANILILFSSITNLFIKILKFLK